MLHLFAADEAVTNRIGSLIADSLRSGDLVLLDGDLGAGKTALARAIIRRLADDLALEVPSPTFLLVLPYKGVKTQVLHADLYRLGGASDLEELGLFDNEEAIVLVEWPDRDPELAARADLVVKLDLPYDGDGRRVNIATPATPERWLELTRSLSDIAV